MQPHDWTSHVAQSAVQTISIAQVDGRHPGSPTAGVALIVLLDGLLPEAPHVRRAVLAEPDVDQKVAVVVVWLEGIRGLIGGPLVDGAGACFHAIPAAELTRALGFVVERRAEWDDAGDLVGCISKNPSRQGVLQRPFRALAEPCAR